MILTYADIRIPFWGENKILSTWGFITIIVVTALILFKSIRGNLRKEDEIERIRQLLSETEQNLDTAYNDIEQRIEKVVTPYRDENKALAEENEALAKIYDSHEDRLKQFLNMQLSSMPWLAGMMADYMTYDIEMQAKYLDWGSDQKRLKKVADIRAIRAEAKALIANAKVAEYQLKYLKQLYPALDDVLDTDYDELPNTTTPPEYDYARDYLSAEEYSHLSDVERNQLALDRYVASHKKSKWQIGRDYEMAVAYEYRKNGYSVDSFGTYKGLEDLGRDIIADKDGKTLIIQCKYWSHEKQIHEKHIFQLYGTTVSYAIEHPLFAPPTPVFVTNITLSPMAREVADALNVRVVEHHEMVDFPRIKCNIGRDDTGHPTKIYHLPMDMQYDAVQIRNAGEFYAFTVQEAVCAGFRRAYKWHGN